MNAPGVRLFLQNAFILKLRRLPFPLHLQGFSVELMSSNRMRGCTTEVLRGSRRQVRISMYHNEKNVGIQRKLFIEGPNEVERGFAIIDSQCAPNSNYTRSFSICRRNLSRHGVLQR